MGYYDALTSGSFKTTPDGRRLFFPWGTLGRGYAIPSEKDFERLQRHINAYYVISLPLVILAVRLQGFLGGALISLPLIVLYAVWARYQCRRLQQTDEKLTLSESVAGQARAHSTVGMWLLEIGVLILIGGGLFGLFLNPSNWLMFTASIAFFGLAAVQIAWMLIIKRRESRSGQ
ncbi:hypothetical protein HFU84_12995 [Acidithiobacillus sp. CV18-2]|uniref:Uncharacterized protein n=1 Tax=Igneacidithiobacillus copahuensis TaxID=2724909 RepID=A0AAE2YNW4_9PROT|nr:hypothetical protein [Igneacidithiobacillus copahuensis]MBU2754910.1 hypothetical protein [Acidithiobacillus sp. CV18-3]MBU2758440.1 hypothetical protein [Acidithiobacillus sp. BN09-2]MBU2778396.1 hypothetical protein [Acidithiobacillus sp. CV18-2]MBU2797483.1 hypothetical protein [Acidithiobacillus sp. VAN18-2]MBU2798260.1 hypothetical protein [Acidithiobacillus sp. VAN18-4]UTV81848.1 hypothetical protein MQE22_04265 [Acidithiobacillus sp. YTS05]